MSLIRNWISPTKLGKLIMFFKTNTDLLHCYNYNSLMFKRSEGKENEIMCEERCLVIIQCDSGHLHGDLIACARHRIYDLRAKADTMLATHVLFIVHLPQQVSSSSFVSFQGDPWISSHIDDLRQPSDTVVSTKEAIGMTISELFLGQLNPQGFELSIGRQASSSSSGGDTGRTEDVLSDDDEFFDALENVEDTCSEDEGKTLQESVDDNTDGNSQVYETSSPIPEDKEMECDEDHSTEMMEIDTINKPTLVIASLQTKEPAYQESSQRSPLFRRLHTCIQAAASRLKDSTIKRSTKRVEILVQLIPKDLPIAPGLI